MPDSSFIKASLFAVLMVIIAIKDIKTREIPPLYCVGVSLLSLLDFGAENLLGIGIPIILWLTASFICPDRLGGGDIKLCFATSIVIGFTATTYGVILAFGMLTILWRMMLKFKSKQEVANMSLPLAPFLAVAFLITYFMKLGGAIL